MFKIIYSSDVQSELILDYLKVKKLYVHGEFWTLF